MARQILGIRVYFLEHVLFEGLSTQMLEVILSVLLEEPQKNFLVGILLSLIIRQCEGMATLLVKSSQSVRRVDKTLLESVETRILRLPSDHW